MENQNNKDFWLNKWNANEIGFHLEDVNPLLKKYSCSFFPSSSSVLVPLCGKTVDMLYLNQLKHRILGVEFSELAVKSFFHDIYRHSQPSNSKLSVEQGSNFNSYQQNDLEILVGDIFDLEKNHTRSIQCVYDRAALIALPPEVRKRYVEHIRKLIPSAKLLLITLDYDQNIMSGPPFSVDKAEVNKLFSFAKVNQMEREDILDKNAKFQAAGLKHFYQTVYQIVW